MISLGNVNFNMILSVVIIAFLLFMIGSHIFKRLRWNLNLEGFEGEQAENTDENTAGSPDAKTLDSQTPDAKMPVPDVKTPDTQTPDIQTSASQTPDVKMPVSQTPDVASEAQENQVDSSADTDKATMMTDLFESVNKQMDIIRTLKLSENMIPIKIDKNVPESLLILANLKLLINNGVYKNELDLKEIYDKYIGNKAVQVLASDINSLNMESLDNVSQTETTYLTRTKSVVDGHQKIIDKILENKSKE